MESAIVLNWNEIHVSLDTVKRLLEEKIEVIVIDNGSDDISHAEFVKFGDKIKYVRLDKNYGSSIGRNTGVQLVTTEKTFLIDGDILYVPGTIKLYSELLDKYPEAACIGYFDYFKSAKNNGHWSGTLKREEADAQVGKPTQINCWYPMAWTQYGLFRTSVLKELKFVTAPPFNTHGWGYEDDWFFYHMRSRGWKSYSVDTPVYYHDKNFGRRELVKRNMQDHFKERRKAFCEYWGMSFDKYEETVSLIEKKYIPL